jgi:uncharacterized protein DUF1835
MTGWVGLRRKRSGRGIAAAMSKRETRGGRAMLHITNGDSAAASLRAAGLPGEVLAWRDVPTEGPMPEGLALDELALVRARFLAQTGWASYDEALADLRRQYATLAAAAQQDEVVLWFEHDLHDQLQLAQLLDWFATHAHSSTMLSLVMIGEHAEVTPFYGLGQLTPEQLAALFPARLPVAAAQLALGRAAWEAFRAPDPTAIESLLAGETVDLPYLHATLIRHLEEFPDTEAGLSRTERQILEMMAEAGPISLFEVFKRDMKREEAPFLGDLGFWARVAGLAPAAHPLLAFADGRSFTLPDDPAHPAEWARQSVALTGTGQMVLAGEQDWVRLNGINRWLGGVHLKGLEAAWRWDRTAQRLVG